MKKQIKIVIRILFLMAFIFCIEKDGRSKGNIMSDTMEYSTGSTIDTNRYVSDADSFDDEQIYRTIELGAGNGLKSRILSPNCCISGFRYADLIWQPPKCQHQNPYKSADTIQPIQNYLKS